MKTLYDVLGVAADATHSQIENGYRVCLEAFIDSQGTVETAEADARRMRLIREAYLLLSSPKRRSAYDRRLQRYRAWRGKEMLRRARMRIVALCLGVTGVAGGVYALANYYFFSHAEPAVTAAAAAMPAAATAATTPATPKPVIAPDPGTKAQDAPQQ